MAKTIRIHNIIKNTTVLGPGNRAAIWLQGCMRNCPGCMSQRSRSLEGGKILGIDKIVKAITSIENIEGVTISGGEPFLQVDSLHELLKLIRFSSNLSVIIYTGYTLNELKRMNNPKIEQILTDFTDILIDGEYIDELNDGVALRGSSNQVVHFLSPRYIDCKEIYNSKKRNTEIRISDKDAFFVGIPEKETLQTWLKTRNILNDNEVKS